MTERANIELMVTDPYWNGVVELSAKPDLPFQIHTGHARIQGSNPMLLVDLIAANPNTKFILFHGGHPWIGETGSASRAAAAGLVIPKKWVTRISDGPDPSFAGFEPFARCHGRHACASGCWLFSREGLEGRREESGWPRLPLRV